MRQLQNKAFLKHERVLVYWNPADKYSYDPAELEIEPKGWKARIGKNFQSYRQRTQVHSLWSVTTGQPHAYQLAKNLKKNDPINTPYRQVGDV